ncbi:MAG: GGDEF domain-containing protein, partial [Campylobacter ureolyticus]|nr:GGDEF domain-containing protein [Campylobacter ureolyticus]
MNKQQVTISSLLILIFILATFLALNFAEDRLKLEAALLENDENFKKQSDLEYIIFDNEYKIIEQFSPNLGNLNEIYQNIKFEKINFKQNKKTKKFEFFYITKNNGLIIIIYKSFF